MSKEMILIPELRFPEFEKDGEWTTSSIDEVCDILNNIRKPVTSTNRTAGEYPYYGASGVIDYIDKYLFDERLLLIGEDGAKWGPYDKTAFLVEGKYWVNNHAHVLKPIGIDDKLLESYLVKLNLNPYITGAAPPKLTLGKLKGIPVPIPKSPREQQKIASCLSSLDELITAHTDKLEALKDHKKGLLQNLLSQEGETVPRVRFPEFEDDGEWELDNVNSLFDLQDGYPFSSKVFTTNPENGQQVIRITDINNQNKNPEKVYIPEEKIEELGIDAYSVKQGDLLLSLTGAAGFNFYLWKNGVAFINQRTMKITPKESKNEFLKVLLSPLIHEKINGIGTGQNNNLSKDALKAIEFPVPQPKEQQKIASCLSAVDELITAQQEKIEQLQQHKKGLMQGLFPKIEN